MTVRPRRLVLLGHPVAHSLSPRFQNAALRSAKIPVLYEALDVLPDELDGTLDALKAERSGGNVTIPHKMRAAARCGRLTPVAERTGAVNTFFVDDDGVLVGDNTDVGGFDKLVRDTLGAEPAGIRVALIGAGGGARAVLAAVERWRECTVALYNRSADRAAQLARDLFPAETESLEREYLALLSRAKSNRAGVGTARDLYEKNVKPSQATFESIAAHYAISALFEPYPEKTRLYCYDVETTETVSRQTGRARLLGGTALHIIAAASLGMFLATFARTMPQFALLMVLVLMPLQMLSGGVTPRESMPEFVQQIMIAAPTTHFVKLAQGIIFRGGAFDVIWPQFLALGLISAALFGVALMRFRKTIGSM